MLDVLIIDDEPNVRQGLKVIVPWEENGFKICGESGDADEGLQKILCLKPDIVLIDIKMPGKLGTDVIRDARKSGFNGKFIIVSGYSNFEYAKDAIKYGVKSYILKPIDEDELMEVLLELSKEIKSEQKLKYDKDLIKEVNLRKLILNEISDVDESYLKYNSFQIALISVDNYSKDDDKILELEKIAKNILKNYSDQIDIVLINTYLAILLKDFNSMRVLKTLTDFKKKLYDNINDDIFITIGNRVNNVKLIYKSYNSARDLIKNKFLYKEKGILSNRIIEDDFKRISNVTEINPERIYSYVEINDIENLTFSLKNMGYYMKQMEYSEKKIKIIATKLSLELKETLIKDYELPDDTLPSKDEILEEIYSKTSLNDIIECLTTNFTDMSKKIISKSSGSVIKRIIDYMNKNYYKDLKLETLSEIFNYNSAYLGKLFKNETGENFNAFLDKIRIQKAKYLLVEKDLKVYKVCEAVGYKNLDYFHSKFKKYVGTSPLNYKKKNVQNG